MNNISAITSAVFLLTSMIYFIDISPLFYLGDWKREAKPTICNQNLARK